jgi:hypothetical protein
MAPDPARAGLGGIFRYLCRVGSREFHRLGNHGSEWLSLFVVTPLAASTPARRTSVK